eukprot:6319032-Pyramimonas_sp.AAC.1
MSRRGCGVTIVSHLHVPSRVYARRPLPTRVSDPADVAVSAKGSVSINPGLELSSFVIKRLTNGLLTDSFRLWDAPDTSRAREGCDPPS